MSTTDYTSLNKTELIELCRQHGELNANPGMSEEDLISILEGNLDSSDFPEDLLDTDREMMQHLMQHHPDITYSQLKCSSEKYFCPECPVGRVACCTSVECEPSLRTSIRIEMSLARKRRG
jgi:hypothetical protein